MRHLRFALAAFLAWCLPALAQQFPGTLNMATAQVSVTSAATQIVAAHTGRAFVMVVNDGSVNVFVGPTSAVTATTGMLIPPSTTVPIPVSLAYQGALYGITATGSETVSVAELF